MSIAATLTDLYQRADQDQCLITLSEWEDPRVQQAVVRVNSQFENLSAQLVVPQRAIPTLSPDLQPHAVAMVEGNKGDTEENDDQAQQLASILYQRRKHKGLTMEQALDALNDPLVYASLLVANGQAHGTVNGAVYTTADVIRAYLQAFGTAPNSKIVSSYFLMVLKPGTDAEQAVVYADCGLNIDPDAAMLAEIALQSAGSLNALTRQDPKIAFLSFSTKGSAQHPRVDKVTQALALAQRAAPDMPMDGELQFDAAFLPSVGQRKAPGSPVAGLANVFVFPDLDAGNIAYKITERLGGAIALGPIVQGLAKPANDLSRGCSVEDIVTMCAITALQGRA